MPRGASSAVEVALVEEITTGASGPGNLIPMVDGCQ
jgi:hypothetical protein